MKANNPAKKPPLQVTCDARELFTGEQAARYLQLGNDRIRQAVSQKALCPARVGKYSVFTRRDLDRYKRLEREHEIARQLVAGTHPLDIYLGAPPRRTTAQRSRRSPTHQATATPPHQAGSGRQAASRALRAPPRTHPPQCARS